MCLGNQMLHCRNSLQVDRDSESVCCVSDKLVSGVIADIRKVNQFVGGFAEILIHVHGWLLWLVVELLGGVNAGARALAAEENQ